MSMLLSTSELISTRPACMCPQPDCQTTDFSVASKDNKEFCDFLIAGKGIRKLKVVTQDCILNEIEVSHENVAAAFPDRSEVWYRETNSCSVFHKRTVLQPEKEFSKTSYIQITRRRQVESRRDGNQHAYEKNGAILAKLFEIRFSQNHFSYVLVFANGRALKKDSQGSLFEPTVNREINDNSYGEAYLNALSRGYKPSRSLVMIRGTRFCEMECTQNSGTLKPMKFNLDYIRDEIFKKGEKVSFGPEGTNEDFGMDIPTGKVKGYEEIIDGDSPDLKWINVVLKRETCNTRREEKIDKFPICLINGENGKTKFTPLAKLYEIPVTENLYTYLLLFYDGSYIRTDLI